MYIVNFGFYSAEEIPLKLASKMRPKNRPLGHSVASHSLTFTQLSYDFHLFRRQNKLFSYIYSGNN
jgi:hypothetical protein